MFNNTPFAIIYFLSQWLDTKTTESHVRIYKILRAPDCPCWSPKVQRGWENPPQGTTFLPSAQPLLRVGGHLGSKAGTGLGNPLR